MEEKRATTVVASRGCEMDLGNQREQIKRLRDIAGLSQHKLARLAGLGRNRISLFECGYVQLKEEELAVVQRAIRGVLIEKRLYLGTALNGNLELVEGGEGDRG